VRCVFDTSVLVSALLLNPSKPRLALDRVLQTGEVLLCLAVLAELYEVLARPRFRRYVDEEDIRRFLATLTRNARWVDTDVEVTICRDPKDNKFLALAVCGHADYLVTGDSDLIVLHPFQNIQILAPSSFLEILDS
jgi:hypothetical protein